MKRKVLIILGILISMMCIIGISYAVWRLTISQTGINKIATSCLKLELAKEENIINLQNAYPIYDEEGKTLTPYSFTITNTCDMFASFIVQLEMTSSSTLPSKYVRVMMNNEQILNLNEYEESTEYVSRDTTEARILARGSLGSGDSEDYTLRLWIDSDVDQNTTDAIGKTLSAKITIIASPSTYNPIENGITTLHDAILASEYQTSNIEVAKEKIASKQQPDFTKTAPIIDWQENHETAVSSTYANMANPADVGSGKDYAINLTDENVYPAVGTSYTFDSETGRYTINNLQYVDPTTLDYENNDYYFYSAFTDIDSSGIMNPYTSSSGTYLYKIESVTKAKSELTASNGTSYPAIRYTFTGHQYNQTELESDKSDKGLYTTSDDYGTSYYYRGSVKNNYVQFAGFYWRVIRINGDGSIRLLYAGETKDASGENLGIGRSMFNDAFNKPLYSGYMHGNPDGTTLDEVNANTNDSIMKTYLENWYSKNLSEYSKFIADSGFCNDRSLASYSWNGDGIHTNTSTYYATHERYTTSYNPTLICPEAQRDLYTLNNNSKGNRSLTYPIGLITVDELMLAGIANNYMNRLFYAYSNISYWTMSPSYFYERINNVAMYQFTSNEASANLNGGLTYLTLVRPVINLNSNVEITGGIGTKNEPFIVKTI